MPTVLKKRAVMALSIAIGWMFAFDCFAAAPVYFDIGGFLLHFLVVGLWYGAATIGFFASPWLFKKWRTRFLFATAMLVLLAGPIVVFVTMENHRQEQHEASIRRRIAAFESFCTKRSIHPYKVVKSSASISIAMRHDTAHGTHHVRELNAAAIATFLAKNGVCSTSSVDALEGAVDYKFDMLTADRIPTEVLRWKLCPVSQAQSPSQTFSPRYELRIMSSDVEQYQAAWMNRYSVAIVDKATEDTLAQDWVHTTSLNSEGVPGCTHPQRQILEMIKSVFPREP